MKPRAAVLGVVLVLALLLTLPPLAHAQQPGEVQCDHLRIAGEVPT